MPFDAGLSGSVDRGNAFGGNRGCDGRGKGGNSGQEESRHMRDGFGLRGALPLLST